MSNLSGQNINYYIVDIKNLSDEDQIKEVLNNANIQRQLPKDGVLLCKLSDHYQMYIIDSDGQSYPVRYPVTASDASVKSELSKSINQLKDIYSTRISNLIENYEKDVDKYFEKKLEDFNKTKDEAFQKAIDELVKKDVDLDVDKLNRSIADLEKLNSKIVELYAKIEALEAYHSSQNNSSENETEKTPTEEITE